MHRFRIALIVAVGLSLPLIAGCDRAEDIAGPGEDDEPLFSQIQTEIFTPLCSGCHTSGGAAGLNLSAEEVSYANLVGVNALFSPDLLRVEPGNPDDSFLMIKLEGGERLVGQRMPAGGANPLSEDQLKLVRDWIADGAPRE